MNIKNKYFVLLKLLLVLCFNPLQANVTTLADKLRIPSEALEQYPDFAHFASKNYIHRHIHLHQHHIMLDEYLQPHLMFEGRYLPWSEIQPFLESSSEGVIQNYYYTFRGLIPGNPATHLQAFKKIEKQPKEDYALEILTYTENFPPHVWVRLINPEGEIISAGFWPNAIFQSTKEYLKVLKPSIGKVFSPDAFEITTSPHQWVVSKHTLSQQQYEDLIIYLKTIQENQRLYYQGVGVGGYNCASFVEELAHLVGLKVPTTSRTMPVPNPQIIQAWQLSLPHMVK